MNIASNSFEPLETIASQPSHLARWRQCSGAGFNLSSYVFIGQRTNGVPVRMAFVAGLSSADPLAMRALAKLLVELEVAPLAGADYALFSYAVTADPEPGQSSPILGIPREDRAIARLIEADLERNDVDGVISLATNERVTGVQLETGHELIAAEVAWPTLEAAGRFVPLAADPVKVVKHNAPGATGQMFNLTIRTPHTSPPDDQISAIVFASLHFLRQYRRLRRSTLDV